MKSRFLTYAVTVLAGCTIAVLRCPAATTSFFDNFDSGTDSGWTHLEPLAQFGAPGAFSFPNGGYRIQASASPDPTNLGSGRAGSLRTDLNFAGFFAGFDLLAWNNSLSQSIGLLGRVTSPGFGTTKGYAFTYSTAGSISIALLNNEHLTTLASAPLNLDPTKRYNFQFDGIGHALTGGVYDPANHNNLVALLAVDDDAYAQGVSGFYLFSNVGSGTADATFDNYRAVALVPEPSTVSLLFLGAAVLLWTAIRRHKETESSRRSPD